MEGTTYLSACDFSKASVIWLLPDGDISWGICDYLGRIWGGGISSSSVAGDTMAAVVSVWGITTAGTFNSVVPYFISQTEVVGRVPSSWLCLFVNGHLLLPNALHAVLYCFGDCTHHIARFIIIAQLCIIFIIMVFFPIFLNFRTCKIAQTSVSNGSGLPGCGPGLEPDRTDQSGSWPGKQGYPPRLGTGSNRTAVPFYGSDNFGSN